MSLQIGSTTTQNTLDIYSASRTALSLTPSATLAKRCRIRATVSGLNAAGGVLIWRTSVDGKVFRQEEQVVVAGDANVCYETPVVTVPANGTFTVTCQSSNSGDTSVTLVGVCWSAEEQDEATADHTTAGSAGKAVDDVAANYMRRSTSADLPVLTAAQLANAFAVDMADIEDTAPVDSLCALVLGGLHWSLSGTTLTIKKTDGTTFDTITVTTDTDTTPVIGAG